ncbi:MAG: S8 family serine peptidase [Acidimicrobiia bacterium]|nr:S8 family serine peptidase [Acidimicrobiia bacterium]
MGPDLSTVSRLHPRRFALVVAFLLMVSMLAATPALAAKGGKKAGGDSTTTTTVQDTTTTTVVSQSGSFVQWEDASALTDYSHGQYTGSMFWVTNHQTGAAEFWKDGYTGAGVDVALIDTGVVPVDGLTYPGKVINGPDLSFESQADNLRYLDTYGHGTHLAGIIAGRSDAATSIAKGDDDHFLGMAPDARIINVKVSDAHGATDVSQVIAAIDWVIQHKNDNGMNIRVINLAYGTDSTQPYQIDPLSDIVEQAWEAGIVVVVAAGNDGNAAPLRNPAHDPFVIAVGSYDPVHGAGDVSASDFSSCGTSERFVDVVAPGRSIVSLRSPGSYADEFYGVAAVADSFFLGSGTSQAAAVVTGAVALLLEQRPELTPDQVKQILTHESARQLDGVPYNCQGAGALDLGEAAIAPTPTTKSSAQTYAPSDGSGSLEAARGTDHVYDEGVPLEGEQDIMSSLWTPYVCTTTTEGAGKNKITTTTCDSKWAGGDFNGASWSGASWSGASWSGASWSGASWSSKTWSGASWSGASWSGASWSGASWSGASWSGASWSGLSWG